MAKIEPLAETRVQADTHRFDFGTKYVYPDVNFVPQLRFRVLSIMPRIPEISVGI